MSELVNKARTVMASSIRELVGNTPLLKIGSLSKLTGCDLFLKCENLNPGGSIKDRAALQMVEDAIADGRLKNGMTIVEGTAGNTGIGLALVGRSLGFDVLIVMPKGQAVEKERMISLYGAGLKIVEAVPFANENHFFHTAGRIARESLEKYWWANQFDNLSNFKAHYSRTGPEILEQTGGNLDYLVSAAGTGGTIGGNSVFLKEKIPGIKVVLADPDGSGLCSYMKTGEIKSSGSSFTEGIGIMRIVANFAMAKVDEALTVADKELVAVAWHLREHDGIVLGSSAALNVTACLKVALRSGPGKRLATFWCDVSERSMTKLYNEEFLATKEIIVKNGRPTFSLNDLCATLQKSN